MLKSILVFYHFLYTTFMELPATFARYPVCSISIKDVISKHMQHTLGSIVSPLLTLLVCSLYGSYATAPSLTVTSAMPTLQLAVH